MENSHHIIYYGRTDLNIWVDIDQCVTEWLYGRHLSNEKVWVRVLVQPSSIQTSIPNRSDYWIVSRWCWRLRSKPHFWEERLATRLWHSGVHPTVGSKAMHWNGNEDHPLESVRVTHNQWFFFYFIDQCEPNNVFYTVVRAICPYWLPMCFSAAISKQCLHLKDTRIKDNKSPFFSFTGLHIFVLPKRCSSLT